MYFFNGYPRDTGATDMMDSARLAGMMALIGYTTAPNLKDYFKHTDSDFFLLVRCPAVARSDDKASDPSNFSRDQLMPFIAGLKMQGADWYCKEVLNDHRNRNWFCQNGDWLSPSHRLHLKLCAGEKGNWFEYLWLKADIWFHSTYMPVEEPNQILAMVMIAGDKYLKKFCESNTLWQNAIRDYWGRWREEGVFAEQMIAFIKTKLEDKK